MNKRKSRKQNRVIFLASVAIGVFVISVNIFAQGVAPSSQGVFKYDSLKELFKVNGILHASGNRFFIGQEVNVAGSTPFLSVFNNLIFRGAQSRYIGAQVIEPTTLRTSAIRMNRETPLKINPPGNRFTFTSPNLDVQVVTYASVSSPQGVVVGNAGAPEVATVKVPQVQASVIASADGVTPLTVGKGGLITRLQIPQDNTISRIYAGTLDNNTPLCQVVDLTPDFTVYNAAKSITVAFSPNTCPAETPYLLDANLGTRKVICCNACKMNTGISGASPDCSAQIRTITPLSP